MALDNQTTEFIKTHLGQLVKTYSVYDGSNRLIEYYETVLNAKNGESCLKTTYTYDGTSGRILKSKETADVWSSSYDI